MHGPMNVKFGSKILKLPQVFLLFKQRSFGKRSCPFWEYGVKFKVCRLQNTEKRSVNTSHTVFYIVRICWPTYADV